ncbi:ESPR-type extended signal peptide-containing protein [Burkholderia gladioli]|uniref:ESPR-type extended signal peptide-containing protein n=1 Tax=Burkholderia gladioli TaxID=28095 RepID=UPI001C259932|nr:hypothetical protein [Burkholderia gladioli]
MNKSYRVVWNVSSKMWTVASELAKSRKGGKPSKATAEGVACSSGKRIVLAVVGFAAVSAALSGQAWADEGASNVAGVVTGNSNLNRKVVAIGDGARALGFEELVNWYASVAVGGDAEASGKASIALGQNSRATAQHSIALGSSARAYSNDAIALGLMSNANNIEAVSVGRDSTAEGVSSVALGAAATATGARSVALGSGSIADRDRTVGVGGRVIIGVGRGTESEDAVNVQQLSDLAAVLGGGGGER